MFPAEKNERIERVGFELRAAGVKSDTLHSGTHTRGYLPHVKCEGASYFVTFRLNDSLPQNVLMKLQAERADWLRDFYSKDREQWEAQSSAGLRKIERDYFRKIEELLDQGSGECLLVRPEVAEVVASALRYFDRERYRLHAWVVMPNHVHAVVWPMPNYALSQILQSWKRFTARQINKQLGRVGDRFWQPESYDHWIRSDDEYARCCQYTTNNPVKARLCVAPEEWRWSSAWAAS